MLLTAVWSRPSRPAGQVQQRGVPAVHGQAVRPQRVRDPPAEGAPGGPPSPRRVPPCPPHTAALAALVVAAPCPAGTPNLSRHRPAAATTGRSGPVSVRPVNRRPGRPAAHGTWPGRARSPLRRLGLSALLAGGWVKAPGRVGPARRQRGSRFVLTKPLFFPSALPFRWRRG